MNQIRVAAVLFCAGLLAMPIADRSALAAEKYTNVVLAVHGGTGRAKAEMTPQHAQELRAALEQSLRAGYQRLQEPGGTSLDAVEAAIRVLEDSPLFNAGKG